jgi:adenylate cyclase
LFNTESGAAGDGVSQPSADAVRGELERLLASAEFVASDRLKEFLRFVVEHRLAGRADSLKAYTIALEVFGRDSTFDPQTDPVVRMEASKLRRRLERYYLGAGHRDPVRIDIPKGGYAPTFRYRPDTGIGPIVAPPAIPTRRRGPPYHWLGMAALALTGVLLLLALRSESPTVGADKGRAPLHERRPAIVVMPLEDLSEGQAGEVFAGGLTDELASNLMRSGEFRLYSIYGRSLTEPTAEPAALSERLNIGYVVKGSVRGRPDRVRLIVHLIDAQTGQYVWADTYDRALTPENVLAVQEQLAADVARQLAAHTALSRE